MSRLRVPEECQLGLNWCWAAASVSVARFYERAGTSWTQCRIAARVLQMSPDSCCTHDGTGDCGGGKTALEACDQRGDAGHALDAMGHLDGPPVPFVAGLVARIRDECVRRPVVVLVMTAAYPLGHYYVLCGMVEGTDVFEVLDPADQVERLSFAALVATARQVCFTR
jgi:hypothetical protein